MNYKWKCQACKREFEQDVSLDNYDSFKASEHECPFCKKNAIFQRVIEWDGLATNLGGYSDIVGKASWQS